MGSLGLKWQRMRSTRGRDDEAMALLKACWQDADNAVQLAASDASYLVVDCEMSSLDPADGELLSIGWVEVNQNSVSLASAQHLLFRPENSVGQSATIHQLRDCELSDGLVSTDVLEQFLSAARGRVLVFHFAPLDMAFLDKLCQQSLGSRLLLPLIDTMVLEKRVLDRSETPLTKDSLRLSTCRKRHGLPDYPAHNALMDALATAELFLAQLAARGNGKVRELLS